MDEQYRIKEKNEDLIDTRERISEIETAPKKKLNNGQKPEEKKKFDYKLPGGLQTYLDDIKKREDFAQDYLKDNFNRRNKQYASSEQYRNDVDTLAKITGGQQVEIKYADRIRMEHRVASKKFSDMAEDSKTFLKIVSFGIAGDSDAMQAIKKRVNILQNFRSGSMAMFKKDEATYDADKFASVVNDAFEGAISACHNYIDTHRKTPRTIWGKRRLSLVHETLNQLELDFMKYREAIDVLASNAYSGNEELKTPEDLIEREDFVEVKEAIHQREGNSTEVYLATVEETVEEDGRNKTEQKQYYMKENLPLINKDIDGFLERRKGELTASLEYKNQIIQDREEELRMSKAKADETDYQNGIGFLKLLQDMINDTKDVTEKSELRREFALLFKHDFDKVFRELKEYNGAAVYFSENRITSIEELREEAQTDPQAKVVLEILLNSKNRGKQSRVEVPKEMTPAEWVIRELNIQNKRIKDFLNNIDKQPINTNMRQMDANDQKAQYVQVSRIEALFRISMGKEVELYGQMMEKDKIEDNEMSQYNTMATSYLGDNFGFRNEVVSTKIKKTSFTRWDGKKSERTVTLQEVAKGKEWLDVIKTHRDVNLSMNAVKQLIRLQMFDTLTQQKDRHGRNFKCEVKESGWRNGTATVEKIKAYDHDQSFTTGNLATSFEEKRDKHGKLIEAKNNRFLPSLQTVIKKNSPEYKYILRKYFGVNKLDRTWMKNETRKKIMDYKFEDGRIDNSKEVEIPMEGKKRDWLLTSFYGHKREGDKTCVACSIELTTDENAKDSTTTSVRQVMPNSVIVKRGNGRVQRNRNGEVERTHEGDIPVFESTRKTGFLEYSRTYNAKGKEIMTRVCDIMKTLSEFYVREDITAQTGIYQRQYGKDGGSYNVQLYFKSGEELSKSNEKLRAAAKAVKELKLLNMEYDFRDVVVLHSGVAEAKHQEGYEFDDKQNFFPTVDTYSYTGLLQAWIDATLKMFADSYADNEMVQQVMDEVEDDEIPADVQSLMNDNGDLVIPNMLHMDYSAYKSIEDMVSGFENGTLKVELKKKHLTDAAIDSLETRAKEMYARINDEIKPAAEKFLNRMYPDPNDKRRQFFLKDDNDYNRFDSLYDFAVDPGNTYLVQDNKHFLACNEEFAQYLSEDDKKKILNMRNDTVKDTKRWNKPEGERELTTVISDRIIK